MKVTRTAMCLTVAAVALVIGATSYAFACSAGASMDDLSINQGPRGSEVTVSGSWFNFANGQNVVVGPVEIRWGSEAGPLLATATEDQWTVKVTIPDSPPGFYLITAASYTANREVVNRNSQTFRVTGPATTTSPTAGGSTNTGDPGPASNNTPAPASVTSVEPAVATPAATPTPAPALAQPSPEPRSAASAPAQSASPTVANAVTTGSPVSQSVSPVKAIAPVALHLDGPATAAPVQVSPAPTPSSAETVAPLPDPAALWSTTDTASGTVRPSLVSEPVGSRSGSPMAIGLLAFGTLSLFATGVVAVANRRRVAAHSGTTR